MFSDKSPYIITIILAALAWTVTHLVDRITQTPTIEYNKDEKTDDIKYSKDKQEKHVAIVLTNVSRNHVFTDLNVTIGAPPGGTLLRTSNPTPVEPADEGDSPVIQDGNTVQVTFPQLQPGWTFIIDVWYKGSFLPSVRFKIEGLSFFTPPSLDTFLLKYEEIILIVLIICWIVSLTYLAITERRRAHEKTSNTGISLA